MTDIRIAVAGCAGRMGRTLMRTILETTGTTLAGGTERPGSPFIGQDLGTLIGVEPLGMAVSGDPLPVLVKADAVVDFTTPAATVALAELTAQARIVHVIGTTGMTGEDDARLAAAARHAVIVKSGNMSLGVNLLAALTRKVAAALDADWDIEVIEMHHRHKVDAPSGTAILLGEAAAEGRGATLGDLRDPPRDGQTGPRPRGTIGMAALRGGNVVGEHDVIFAADGERVILRHVATDRGIFARGAVKAAMWGHGRSPGIYAMADVLGLG